MTKPECFSDKTRICMLIMPNVPFIWWRKKNSWLKFVNIIWWWEFFCKDEWTPEFNVKFFCDVNMQSMQKRLIFQSMSGFINNLTQSKMRSYILKCSFVASIPVLRFCKVTKDYCKTQVFVWYVFLVKFKITIKSLKFVCVLTWRSI